MKLYFVRVDPVQEIAAEPGTLDLLRDILRPKEHEPRADPELLAAARLTGWPLVSDHTIEPGVAFEVPRLKELATAYALVVHGKSSN
ncbi:hypothetical protein [Streptomyces sp. NPDC003877]